jgi:hypothetical protein
MADKKISKKQLHYFKKIPFRLKLVILETLFFMALARFFILFIPFRRVASIMGKPMCETSEEIDPDLLLNTRQIAWLINKLSSYTPWESKCLVKALTGQIMLKKRKIPCTLYLGMAKDKANKLSAHAWLRCGNSIILGENERSGFITVAYFSTG